MNTHDNFYNDNELLFPMAFDCFHVTAKTRPDMTNRLFGVGNVFKTVFDHVMSHIYFPLKNTLLE